MLWSDGSLETIFWTLGSNILLYLNMCWFSYLIYNKWNKTTFHEGQLHIYLLPGRVLKRDNRKNLFSDIYMYTYSAIFEVMCSSQSISNMLKVCIIILYIGILISCILILDAICIWIFFSDNLTKAQNFLRERSITQYNETSTKTQEKTNVFINCCLGWKNYILG